jgi:hypothetical protein
LSESFCARESVSRVDGRDPLEFVSTGLQPKDSSLKTWELTPEAEKVHSEAGRRYALAILLVVVWSNVGALQGLSREMGCRISIDSRCTKIIGKELRKLKRQISKCVA